MSTEVRGATAADALDIRAILARAFPTEDEADLWDYLVTHDRGFDFDGVRLACVNGRPVACTVVLPRQIRGRIGWVSGAVITLVACLPGDQGKGYAGETLIDALAYVQEQEWALAMLYGHPSYYPRFGFVPVLPRYETQLRVTGAPPNSVPLRGARDEDLAVLGGLYNDYLATYPCAVARDESLWLWHPRNDEQNEVLMLVDGLGYAFVSRLEQASALFVHEAAGPADSLLVALQAHATKHGLERIHLAMPPDHPLVQAAVSQGATQHIHAPSAGMAAVVDPAPLLPPGYWLDDGELLHGVRRIGRMDVAHLVPYMLGVAGLDSDPGIWPIHDLSLDIDRDRLAHDWPRLLPHWSLDPFWS
ncbi:MAG: hypothetical protein NVS2B16_09150 [Chloroflexota bacterium]